MKKYKNAYLSSLLRTTDGRPYKFAANVCKQCRAGFPRPREAKRLPYKHTANVCEHRRGELRSPADRERSEAAER